MTARKHPKPQETVSLTSGNLATARHSWFQSWYRKLGFTVSIPLPPVSDKEFKRRVTLGQSLFYRPSTLVVSYEAFMGTVGQGGHWTVVDNNDRKKIVWEPTQTGYWHWAEVAESCPRLGTPWNILTGEQKLNLLSLEEYVIVWWAHQADTSTKLDINTWSWLRTRFGQCVLDANEYFGRVGVHRYWSLSRLSSSCDSGGGRLAEVVPTVP